MILFFPTVKRFNRSKDVRCCLFTSYEWTDNYSEQMRQLAPELVQPCDLCWPLCSSLVLMKHKAGGERKLACRPTNIPRTTTPRPQPGAESSFTAEGEEDAGTGLCLLDANGEGKRNEGDMGGLGPTPKYSFLIGSKPWWRQNYQVFFTLYGTGEQHYKIKAVPL